MRLRMAAAVLALALAGCGGGSEAPTTDVNVAPAQRTIGSYCLRAPNHLSASGFKGMIRAAHSINGAAKKHPAAYRDDLARAIRRLRSCDPATYRRLKATFDTLR